MMNANDSISLAWQDTLGHQQQALWPVQLSAAPPRRLLAVNDTLSADAAFRHLTQGTALVWEGDYANARQLLQAIGRRLDKRDSKRAPPDGDEAALNAEARRERFNRHRQQQAQRAALLNRFLLCLAPDGSLPLPRAPDTAPACAAAGYRLPFPGPFLLPLRALLGILGSWQWQQKGVPIDGLPAPLHVHYGVFSPLRGDYLPLLWQAPLPDTSLAFDIGTGSGVLAAILAQRGVQRLVATDTNPRALACAAENLARMGFAQRVELQERDTFPDGRSPLIVCNPPWLPARPTSALEQAVYDPDHRMLQGFLAGLQRHLAPNGEAWLIMSNLADHLGLREPGFLESCFDQAGLKVLGRLDTRPGHHRASDTNDPLAFARRAEVTSLWRLGLAAGTPPAPG